MVAEPYGRLRLYQPAEMGGAAQGLLDAITSGPRGVGRTTPMTDEQGRLPGPFNALFLIPSIGLPLQEVGASIRYRGALSDRQRELAIIVIAGRRHCATEWVAHSVLAGPAGVPDADIERARVGAPADEFGGEDRLVVEVVQALLEDHDLDDQLYARADSALGAALLAELVQLVGYYHLLVMGMQVFRVPQPAGQPYPWP